VADDAFWLQSATASKGKGGEELRQLSYAAPKLFSVDSAISRNEGKSCEPQKSRTGWGFNTPPPKDRPRHHWYTEIRQRS